MDFKKKLELSLKVITIPLNPAACAQATYKGHNSAKTQGKIALCTFKRVFGKVRGSLMFNLLMKIID